MKPQRPQRNTLRSLKEYPFEEIIEKRVFIIAQLSIYLRAENITVRLLNNFNVVRLKNVIKRVIL